jgi:hypothetical protein
MKFSITCSVYNRAQYGGIGLKSSEKYYVGIVIVVECHEHQLSTSTQRTVDVIDTQFLSSTSKTRTETPENYKYWSNYR